VVAVLGLLSGLLAGTVIVAFRLGIEAAQASFLPDAGTESYEALGRSSGSDSASRDAPSP